MLCQWRYITNNITSSRILNRPPLTQNTTEKHQFQDRQFNPYHCFFDALSNVTIERGVLENEVGYLKVY